MTSPMFDIGSGMARSSTPLRTSSSPPQNGRLRCHLRQPRHARVADLTYAVVAAVAVEDVSPSPAGSAGVDPAEPSDSSKTGISAQKQGWSPAASFRPNPGRVNVPAEV